MKAPAVTPWPHDRYRFQVAQPSQRPAVPRDGPAGGSRGAPTHPRRPTSTYLTGQPIDRSATGGPREEAKAAASTRVTPLGYTPRSRGARAAAGDRWAPPRAIRARGRPRRVVVTTGSSGGFLLAFLAAFDPGDRVAMAARLPLLPQRPDRARPRGGRGPDLRPRDPLPADSGSSRTLGPARRARRGQPGQPDRHDAAARGAGRAGAWCEEPASADLRRDLPRAHLRPRGAPGRAAPGRPSRRRSSFTQLLQVLLDDRLADRLAARAAACAAPIDVLPATSRSARR